MKKIKKIIKKLLDLIFLPIKIIVVLLASLLLMGNFLFFPEANKKLSNLFGEKLISKVLLILCIIVGAIWGWIKIQEVTSPNLAEIKKPEKVVKEEPRPENETINWKTYRNEEYGFEIKYPKDWQLWQRRRFGGLNVIHTEIFTVETESFYGRVFLNLFTDYEKPCEEFQIDDLESLWGNQEEILVKRRGHQCFTFSYVIDKGPEETQEFKTSFIKNFHMSFSRLKFIKEDITEDWKVYQDGNKGFEIRYPQNIFITEVEEEPLSGSVVFHKFPQWISSHGSFIPSKSLIIEVKEELGGKKAKDIKNMDELKEAIEREFAPFIVKPKAVTLPFSSAFVVEMNTNKYFQYDYYVKDKDKIVRFSLIDDRGNFSPFNLMLSTFRFLE